MSVSDTTQVSGVEYFRADDGRIIAIVIRGDFSAYEAFPPFMRTDAEVAHVSQAYAVGDPTSERYTKAHITPDEMPLQIVMLNRHRGAFTKAHYHIVDREPETETRHQIMMCLRGECTIGVYTREGDHLGTVVMKPHDLVLLTEGHSVEFSGEDTKMIEIKIGPIPGDGREGQDRAGCLRAGRPAETSPAMVTAARMRVSANPPDTSPWRSADALPWLPLPPRGRGLG